MSPRHNNPHTNVNRALGLVAACCAVFLAAEPVAWLLRTWTDAAYESEGEWVFLVTVALFLWSATSRRQCEGSRVLPAVLFSLTAVVRVIGHVLAINVVGALALVLDVYAAGVLLGLKERERAVSPVWVAALFAMSLPLERIAQRVVGFGLQQLSAAGACGTLSATFDDVVCEGTDIVLAGQHVLVDLPCSGARGLVLLAALFAGVSAISRPTWRHALVGAAVATMSALISNTFRICLLAVGIAFREDVGVDVMTQPWHDIVGLVSLAVGLMPIIVWSRLLPAAHAQPAVGQRPAATPVPVTVVIALVAASVAVAATPHAPVDVSREVGEVSLPEKMLGVWAKPTPLSEMEREYFTQFGGAAAKASYGRQTLLVVRTAAPLRHLHAPDECLRGAGYDVERLGVTHAALPGALYRATAPSGEVWRVVVTYVGSDGSTATSVSEAVWHWMRDRNTTWTAVERVSPWGTEPNQIKAFDDEVGRHFFKFTENPKEVQ